MNRTLIPVIALVLALAAFTAPAALAGDDGSAGVGAAPAPETVATPHGTGAPGDGPAAQGASPSLAGAVHLLAAVSVVGLSGFSLFAFLLLVLVVFPSPVEKVRTGMESRPVLSFFLGLVNSVFVLLVVGALAHAGGAGGALGGLLLLAFLMVAILGLSGRAQILGARALALADRAPNPVTNLAVGWWVLYLVGIIPFVGWVLFGYWAASGVGGVLVTLFGRSGASRKDAKDGGIVISGPDYTA